MANLNPLLAQTDTTIRNEDREPDNEEGQEDGVSKTTDGFHGSLNTKNIKYAWAVALAILMIHFLLHVRKENSSKLLKVLRLREEDILYHEFPLHNRNIAVMQLGHTITSSATSDETVRCGRSVFKACLLMEKYHEEYKSKGVLFTVRNPVDRFLAIYADAHPLSCPDPAHFFRKPWVCKMGQFRWSEGSEEHRFYHQCFPHTNNPEPMVRGAIGTNHENSGDCARMAQELIVGGNRISQLLAPDLHYNYQYYVHKAHALKWKDKPDSHEDEMEILVVRAEHEAQDWKFLDRLIGVDPWQWEYTNTIQVPEISPEAYAKLCCLLQEEIELYQFLLTTANNLPAYAKQESLKELQQKCGVQSPQIDRDWGEWRDQYCPQGGDSS